MSEWDHLLRFARLAHRLAQRRLPRYAHKFAPQRYRLAQLAACVLLKHYLNVHWRGMEMWLHGCPQLRQTLGLQRAPDHTTLCRFESRWLSPQWVSGVLAKLLRHCGLTQRAVDVAWDSTGLQVHGASAYFATRHGGRRFRRYIKLSTAVVLHAMVAATVIVDHGASCDKKQLPQLFDETVARLRVRHLLADAGYDSEPLHVACRQRGIASWIPPVCKRADGGYGGYWRARMAKGLPKRYGQRWQAESFFSGLKRVVSDRVNARHAERQLTEAALKVLAYSIHR